MRSYSHIAILFFAALTMLLVSEGCKVGKDYAGIQTDNPENFRFDREEVDTIVNLRWWEMFNDPVLDSLIRFALEHNQDARIALANVQQAGYAFKIQKAELLPKFNLTGSGSYGNFVGGFPGSGTSYLAFGGAAMSWEIDLWGKLRRLNEAAAADFFSSVSNLRAIQLALIADVATGYFRLLEFRRSLIISQQTVALRDSMLLIIDQRFKAGIVPESDLNQAQIQYAIAVSAIPLYQRQIATTEHALSILVGVPPTAIVDSMLLEDQLVPPELPLGLPSQLLTRRPDVMAAEQNAIAQNALIGVAIANRLPTLSITALLAGLGTSISTAGGSVAWNVGGSLLGPIFHWNQNLRRVDIEASRYEQSELLYERTVLNALREVEDALVGINTYHAEVDARMLHVTAAVSMRALSQMRYDKGVTSYLEYLESQRQAFEAQLFLAQARSNLLINYVELYKALGGGWMDEVEEADARAAAVADSIENSQNSQGE